MNLCFFLENHYKGGLDTFLVNLINHWPDETDEITLLCNASHPGIITYRNNCTRKLNILTYDYFIAQGWYFGKDPLPIFNNFATRFLLRVFRKIMASYLFYLYLIPVAIFFRKSKFDRLMVVNGGYPGSLISRVASVSWKLSGKKELSIHNYHNIPFKKNPFSMHEKIRDFLVVSSSAKIITVSIACINGINERISFRKSEKLLCIPNGIVDPDLKKSFKTIDPTISEIIKQDYCLMLSTYHAYKGHKYLLEAFTQVVKKYPAIKLIMCGDGTEIERIRIQTYIEKYSLTMNAILMKFVPDPDLLIRNTKILLVPSQAFESFGLVIVEAMARRVPVVATNIDGIPSVLDDGKQGFICDPTKSDEFAKSIISLLDSPELRRKFGEAGREKYEKCFTATRMANRYYTYLK